MIIADTSIWIEFLKGREDISSIIEREMERQNILALECIFSELLQGAKNKRETNIISGYWNHLPKIEERGLWIEAGLVSAQHKYCSRGIGLIDTFIITCARKSRSKIWTLDKKLGAVLGATEVYGP